MASNTILHILHILEQYTDRNHMLSKEEILKELQEDEFITLEEKAFYRKIEELRELGYDVRSTKGNRTKYILDTPRFTSEELLMLSAIILGSPDISKAEADRLINTLYAMSVHSDYIGTYEKLKPALKSNNQSAQAANQIQKFHVLYTAIKNHEKVSCKIRLNDIDGRPTFSSRGVLEPVSLQFDARRIEELLPYVDRYAAAYEKLEQFNAKFPEDMKKSILQYAIQGKPVEQRPEEGTGKELYRKIQAEKQRLIKTDKLKKTRALPTITGEEVPYDFPASWKVCYIDDIAFVTKLAGFEYTKYISDNLVPTGTPLFKGKNVQNGKFVLSFESYIPESVSDELPRSQITKKCLLTPYVGTIGNIAVFDGSFKAHLGSNVGKIELLNSDTQTFILEEYVLWYLKSTYGYAELTKYKKATAQESISIDAIRNVVIAIPPLEEQRRIVAKLEEILPLCERSK